MKEIYDVLIDSGQMIIEVELISFIIDGLRPEFNLVVVHIMSKINLVGEQVSLVDIRFFL